METQLKNYAGKDIFPVILPQQPSQNVIFLTDMMKGGRYIYHINQETSAEYTYIPAQSIDDIRLAAKCGAKFIEANAHRCADGVYVCKHGINNKLGNALIAKDGQDYSNTMFADVTSTWLRENILFYSPIEGYRTPLLTLDEFCAACHNNGIGVTFEGGTDKLAIARQYLTDDKIQMYWFDQRQDFKGIMHYAWSNNKSVEDNISAANKIGYPLISFIPLEAEKTMTDAELSAYINACHEKGYLTGASYISPSQMLRCRYLGMDVFVSVNRLIDEFDFGNAINLADLSDEKLVKNGCTYDASKGILVMPKGSFVYIPAEAPIERGKVSYSLRYKGTASIKCGVEAESHNLLRQVNDGLRYVNAGILIHKYAQNGPFSNWIEISADEDTEIYELSVYCSYL